MARKEALRELQARLAERLSTVRTQPATRSWLAVECGAHGFLFPLREAGEIFPPSPLLHVPHTHAWFLGVANLRGQLNGVVDLAAFLGLRAAEPTRDRVQLIGFSASLALNCALMVDALAGLRSEGQLKAEADDGSPRPAFVGTRYRDAAGRPWQELNLTALAADEAFLRIVD